MAHLAPQRETSKGVAGDGDALPDPEPGDVRLVRLDDGGEAREVADGEQRVPAPHLPAFDQILPGALRGEHHARDRRPNVGVAGLAAEPLQLAPHGVELLPRRLQLQPRAFELLLAALGAHGLQLVLRRLEVQELAPVLAFLVLELRSRNQTLLEQEPALVDTGPAAFQLQLRLREASPCGRHFRAPLPVLQHLDPLQCLGEVQALAPELGLRPRNVHRHQVLALRHLLPDPNVHGRDDAIHRALHGHRAPGRERSLERDAAVDRPGFDGYPPPARGGAGGRVHGGARTVEQVERPPGPEPGAEEQPDRQHRAETLHHPHLAKRGRQRLVACLDLPVGVLKPAMLLLDRLRHAQLGLAQLAQLGDVAEHRDHRHRLGGTAARMPKIGGGDGERARLVVAPHLDHPPLDTRALRRGVEQELREVVEALARDEQLREGPAVRLARLQSQDLLRRRVERLDPPAQPDDQHAVAEVVEHLAMDVRHGHRPTCSTLMPHPSLVLPDVRSSPAGATARYRIGLTRFRATTRLRNAQLPSVPAGLPHPRETDEG